MKIYQSSVSLASGPKVQLVVMQGFEGAKVLLAYESRRQNSEAENQSLLPVNGTEAATLGIAQHHNHLDDEEASCGVFTFDIYIICLYMSF